MPAATTEEVLESATKTVAETERVAAATLGQLQDQGSQLERAETRIGETEETVREAKSVLRLMAYRIFKEKLRLWLVVLFLFSVDVLLAYRLATNKGRI
ncbi:hypothetical protein CTAYLR_009487 [Chrysophaeum taylorii]|uniref:t-SNARE coiled-coil homology domain-containing protein n=1 Tax=Chrysophaeum taylorii TaxID=2483200 RepID=A0AAD7UL10_9STRA|nr:hypothetical protein CTAYLR_009487 [Chrysophaeum taylorii]